MSINYHSVNHSDGDLDILAANLRALMFRKNIDSTELSKKTGIALTTINALRRGSGNPTLSTLYQLSSFFNVTVGSLTENVKLEDNDRLVLEIPLISINEINEFLENKNKFKNTFVTEIDSIKENAEYYAVKLSNTSISPLFEKGTIFILINSDIAQDGDIVLVQFGENWPCFRKIFIEEKTYLFKPISENIGNTTMSIDAFKIHGIIIKAIQTFQE